MQSSLKYPTIICLLLKMAGKSQVLTRSSGSANVLTLHRIICCLVRCMPIIFRRISRTNCACAVNLTYNLPEILSSSLCEGTVLTTQKMAINFFDFISFYPEINKIMSFHAFFYILLSIYSIIIGTYATKMELENANSYL